jgi:hypothetical protein
MLPRMPAFRSTLLRPVHPDTQIAPRAGSWLRVAKACYPICSASRRLSMSEARNRNARARAGFSAVRRNSS